MKVGSSRCRKSGCGLALSLVVRGSAREVVIVDRTRARARAVATDLRYGAPLCPEVALRDGDYASLAGADLGDACCRESMKTAAPPVALTARGAPSWPTPNVGVFKDMVPKIVSGTRCGDALSSPTFAPDRSPTTVRRLARHDLVLSTGHH